MTINVRVFFGFVVGSAAVASGQFIDLDGTVGEVITAEAPAGEGSPPVVTVPPIEGYDPALHSALLVSPPNGAVNPNFWLGRPPTGLGYTFTNRRVTAQTSTVALISPKWILWARHFNDNYGPAIRTDDDRINDTFYFYDEQGNEYARRFLRLINAWGPNLLAAEAADIALIELDEPLPPSIEPLPIARTVFPGSRVFAFADNWSAGASRSSTAPSSSPATNANQFADSPDANAFSSSSLGSFAGRLNGRLVGGNSGSATLVRAPGGWAVTGTHWFLLGAGSFADGNARRGLPAIRTRIPDLQDTVNACPDFDGNGVTEIFDFFDWLGFYARWDPMATPPSNDLAAANVTPPAWMDLNGDGLLEIFDFFDFLKLLEDCGANMDMIPSASMFVGYEP